MIYTLTDLSELISNMGYNQETVKQMLINAYRIQKAEGVVSMVSDLTFGEINLSPIGQNKYQIKY